MKNESEVDLVKAAIEGDHEAFMSLMQKYDSVISKAIRWRIKDKGMQEDAKQEVYLYAWKGIGNCKIQDKFGGWIRSVAINVRRNITGRVIDRWPDQLDGRNIESDCTPSETLGCVDEINAAVDGLTGAQAELVRDVYMRGFTVAEVADRRDVSKAAVYRVLGRAKKALRVSLKDFEPEGYVDGE